MTHHDGLLVIDKPAGPTSHDVVDIVRRLTGTRRVGHVGTLDPMATGVLPLVIGRVTRLARFFSADRKEYVATLLLGTRTNTFDLEGDVIESREISVGREAIAAALASMIGTFHQTPPTFSAKKIGGTRAHRLARAGAAVAPPPVEVTIFELELVDVALPLVVVRVLSSAGFYVRALAEDLGQRLGPGACLKSLRRTRSGRFGVNEAVPLDRLMAGTADVGGLLTPMSDLLPDLPAAILTSEGVRRMVNGQGLDQTDMAEPVAMSPLMRLLSADGSLVGLGERRGGTGFLHPSVVLR